MLNSSHLKVNLFFPESHKSGLFTIPSSLSVKIYIFFLLLPFGKKKKSINSELDDATALLGFFSVIECDYETCV